MLFYNKILTTFLLLSAVPALGQIPPVIVGRGKPPVLGRAAESTPAVERKTTPACFDESWTDTIELIAKEQSSSAAPKEIVIGTLDLSKSEEQQLDLDGDFYLGSRYVDDYPNEECQALFLKIAHVDGDIGIRGSKEAMVFRIYRNRTTLAGKAYAPFDLCQYETLNGDPESSRCRWQREQAEQQAERDRQWVESWQSRQESKERRERESYGRVLTASERRYKEELEAERWERVLERGRQRSQIVYRLRDALASNNEATRERAREEVRQLTRQNMNANAQEYREIEKAVKKLVKENNKKK